MEAGGGEEGGVVGEGAARVSLPKQQRCPPEVERFARLFLGEGKASAVAAENEPAVMSVVSSGDGDPVDRLAHELNEARKRGLAPSDVSVLSLAGQTKSRLFETEKLGSHRIVHADDPASGEHVVADTFLRFKGLERPYVIVTEV